MIKGLIATDCYTGEALYFDDIEVLAHYLAYTQGKVINLVRSSVKEALRGAKNSAYGYKFRYATEDDLPLRRRVSKLTLDGNTYSNYGTMFNPLLLAKDVIKGDLQEYLPYMDQRNVVGGRLNGCNNSYSFITLDGYEDVVARNGKLKEIEAIIERNNAILLPVDEQEDYYLAGIKNLVARAGAKAGRSSEL